MRILDPKDAQAKDCVYDIIWLPIKTAFCETDISWDRFGATSLIALPIQPIYCKIGLNGPNWQCFLAGSFKTAPRILIFSIGMGAKPSIYIKFIAT